MCNIQFVIKCLYVCIVGMPSLWTDTVWRSFARLWASHAISPLQSSLKPSRAKAFQVIVVHTNPPGHPYHSMSASRQNCCFMLFQLLRISWAGMPKLCPKTWLRWWWRICRAESLAAVSTCTRPPPSRTPHLSASGTSGCRALPATRLEKRFMAKYSLNLWTKSYDCDYEQKWDLQ